MFQWSGIQFGRLLAELKRSIPEAEQMIVCKFPFFKHPHSSLTFPLLPVFGNMWRALVGVCLCYFSSNGPLQSWQWCDWVNDVWYGVHLCNVV